MKWLKKLKRKLWTKRTAIVVSGLLLVFVVVNIGLFVAYKNRTYPKTVVGQQKLGSVAFADIAERSASKGVLPDTVEFSYDNKVVSRPIQALGVSLDRSGLEKQIRLSRHWLPIINVFNTQIITIPTTIDDKKFNEDFASLLTNYQRPAEDAAIVINNGDFVIKEPVDGRTLDATTTKKAITDNLAQGITKINLPIEVKPPAIGRAVVEEQLKSLQTQRNTAITMSYNGKSRKATPQEVASWFSAENTSLAPNIDKIRAFVQAVGAGYGIRVQNLSEVSSAIKTAVTTSKPIETQLVAAPIARKSYNYCLATRGVDQSYLAGLNTKLLAVYADPRGWGLDGLVGLNRADSNCVMTVWLSAASQMSSFGAICDSDWSCRVGANVVINFDRWQGASAAWNAAGGSLDDYRSMVINHETGHWFGFYHADCGGAGQPAPVMQQQSISLQGCTFNPWPLASEKAKLKAQLGL